MNPYLATLRSRVDSFKTEWDMFMAEDADGTERTAFDCGWTACIEYVASLQDCGEPSNAQLELFDPDVK